MFYMELVKPAFVRVQPYQMHGLRLGIRLKCSSFTANNSVDFPLARCSRRSVVTSCAPKTENFEDLQSLVNQTVEDALKNISDAADERALENMRVAYLGKKGSITTMTKKIGKLQPADRPKYGAVLNQAKSTVTEALADKKKKLAESSEDEDEDWIDVTMPGIRPGRTTIGTIHPINSTMDIATEIFQRIGYEIIDDPDLNREIETDYYCFEALNCPKDHPAREMQDTFYLEENKNTLLRSQTSSVQIRYMEKNKPPFRIVAPGKVFRRDTVDATHSPMFHQIEILAIDKMGVLTLGDLKGTVEHFLKKMLGEEAEARFRASYFPFTTPSLEVDVFFRGEWMEVLGCGMVDPAVLENVGLDPEEWSGFAAGFGVERFAMAMHGITDIREFYKNDMRFTRQGMINYDTSNL